MEKEGSPHSSPIMTTPPPPRIILNRPLSPVSPTPQRHHSPVPSSPFESSSPILKARRISTSPSPLVLSPRVASPPADIARQIVTVTQDLAGLRAEERRLIHARRARPQQGVRHHDYSTLCCGSPGLSLTSPSTLPGSTAG